MDRPEFNLGFQVLSGEASRDGLIREAISRGCPLRQRVVNGLADEHPKATATVPCAGPVQAFAWDSTQFATVYSFLLRDTGRLKSMRNTTKNAVWTCNE